MEIGIPKELVNTSDHYMVYKIKERLQQGVLKFFDSEGNFKGIYFNLEGLSLESMELVRFQFIPPKDVYRKLDIIHKKTALNKTQLAQLIIIDSLINKELVW